MTSEMLLEVLSKCESTGSGAGMSLYGERCPRAARLKREAKERGESSTSHKMQVGIVFHKLMELYYLGKLKDVVLPYNPEADFDSDPVQEALRLFVSYQSYFPADEWEVLHAELLFPQDDFQERIVEQTFGITPFSGQIDLVVRIREHHLPHLQEKRGLLIQPGVYLVDFKTSEKKDGNAVMKYELSNQFQAYMMAYNALYGAYDGELCQGTIVVNVVRHAKLELFDKWGAQHSFRTFFVKPPDATSEQVIRNYLKYKKEFLATDMPNIDACVGWDVCNFYVSGLCNRL